MPPTTRKTAPCCRLARVIGCLWLAAAGTLAHADDGRTPVGLGGLLGGPRGGSTSWEVNPPPAPFRSGAELAWAVPTNQWYSSILFQRWGKAIYAQPLSYRATEAGFEIGMPSGHLVIEDEGGRLEWQALHSPAMTISPAGTRLRDARLARHADWLAELDLEAADGSALRTTVLHGSPFSYYECGCGALEIRLAAPPVAIPAAALAAASPHVQAFTVAGKPYAVFAPTGATLAWTSPTTLVVRLPPDRHYLSIAGLPDTAEPTLAAFLGAAFAFPTDTRAEWEFDARASRVRTTFRVVTKAMEGTAATTLMGLYPHHWAALARRPEAPMRYATVRGTIRLIATNAFTTERTYHGIVPAFAALEDPAQRAAVDALLAGDARHADTLFSQYAYGTYWTGKALSALGQLAAIADAEGRADLRDDLLGRIKHRMETWFDGRHSTYYMYRADLGALFGVPQEYNSVHAINDHHFHYGYWLNAAAQVALHDPLWAREDHWGGMVARLVADIATDTRGRADFPYLRNFDAYEGHSWASGLADLDAGNNQESSSEAVNAWAGLILWGEATGNTRLRDLGIYLYTTEADAVRTYWFDADRTVLADGFPKPFASLVFGGKYVYGTWWTEEPRQMLGINVLPITPASTYLGAQPAYVKSLIDGLPAEERRYQARGVIDGTAPDIWQDVLASFLALADPAAGFARWDPAGSVEWGETRTHTRFWLVSLREMGPPDFSVTADTPLYAVFRRADGQRTYLAYNAGAATREVRFSDGRRLEVAPHQLARAH